MKKDWTKKCTCENFQQNEDCEHIGNKVLEEVGLTEGALTPLGEATKQAYERGWKEGRKNLIDEMKKSLKM